MKYEMSPKMKRKADIIKKALAKRMKKDGKKGKKSKMKPEMKGKEY